MIELKNVSFSYKQPNLVLNDISLTFSEGEIWGILGQNGAGKTTLFRLILNLLEANSGKIIRDNTSFGYLPETNGLYEKLTANENLMFRDQIGHTNLSKKKAKQNCKEMLNNVGLLEKKNEKVAYLSSGMRKRIALGCSLMGDPQTILLDEPTNGLDPVSLQVILQIISNLKLKKKIVLINSHDLTSIQDICTHVCIIQHGKIAFKGPITDNSLKDLYFKTLEKEEI